MPGQGTHDLDEFRVEQRFAAADGDDLRADLVQLLRDHCGLRGGQPELVAIRLRPEIADAAAVVAGVENLKVDVNETPSQE